MSVLLVMDEIDSERAIAVGRFVFYVHEGADDTRLLKHFSPWGDLVINEHMLDDFVHDIRHSQGACGVQESGRVITDTAGEVLPLIELAREHHAYIVISGD
jgi:hypothetical protein